VSSLVERFLSDHEPSSNDSIFAINSSSTIDALFHLFSPTMTRTQFHWYSATFLNLLINFDFNESTPMSSMNHPLSLQRYIFQLVILLDQAFTHASSTNDPFPLTDSTLLIESLEHLLFHESILPPLSSIEPSPVFKFQHECLSIYSRFVITKIRQDIHLFASSPSALDEQVNKHVKKTSKRAFDSTITYLSKSAVDALFRLLEESYGHVPTSFNDHVQACIDLIGPAIPPYFCERIISLANISLHQIDHRKDDGTTNSNKYNPEAAPSGLISSIPFSECMDADSLETSSTDPTTFLRSNSLTNPTPLKKDVISLLSQEELSLTPISTNSFDGTLVPVPVISPNVTKNDL
jgi:hypothetical protein